ncbi:MAG: CDP-alcohol phosphatidyltransferase family protein [Planctomycetota bacterium]|jgi:CDP-diacylglycerol--serine O-phosphatidyltransferase
MIPLAFTVKIPYFVSMKKIKPTTRSRRFLGNVRKHRLRTVAILPSMITLVNGICGFAAMGLIVKGEDYYYTAAFLIFIGMIADVLDGRVARLSNTTSSFGGQLDSLCDVITFGAAPAFLVLNLLLTHHGKLVGSAKLILGDFAERFIWVAAVAYLICAMIRLARFNVENEEDETAHMSFAGLPSPAAAGVLAGLIMFNHHVVNDDLYTETGFYQFLHWAILYTLPFITLGCGLLMVSRIRYPHLFNQLFRGRKSINYFYFTLFVAGMIAVCKLQLSLVITFGLFAISGPARALWKKCTRAKLIQKQKPPAEVT